MGGAGLGGVHRLATRLINLPPDDDDLHWLAQVLQITAKRAKPYPPAQRRFMDSIPGHK